MVGHDLAALNTSTSTAMSEYKHQSEDKTTRDRSKLTLKQTQTSKRTDLLQLLMLT